MEISVKDMIFQRDSDGKLIEREVELSLEGKPKVKVIPLTRGELQKIYVLANSDSQDDKLKADTEIIRIGLVNPKLTDEQLSDLKPNWANSLSTAILAESLGVTQEEVKKSQTEAISKELDLKKN